MVLRSIRIEEPYSRGIASCETSAKYSSFQVPAVRQSTRSQNSVFLPWVNLTPQPAKMVRDFLYCRFG